MGMGEALTRLVHSNWPPPLAAFGLTMSPAGAAGCRDCGRDRGDRGDRGGGGGGGGGVPREAAAGDFPEDGRRLAAAMSATGTGERSASALLLLKMAPERRGSMVDGTAG